MERRSDEATNASRNLPPTSIPHFPFSRNEVQYGVFTPLQPDAIRIKNITPTDSQPPSREGGSLFFEERLNSPSHQIALILVIPKIFRFARPAERPSTKAGSHFLGHPLVTKARAKIISARLLTKLSGATMFSAVWSPR